MKTIEFELRGVGRGMLHHRRNVMRDFAEQVKTKRLSRAPSTMAEFKDEAENALHSDKKGPYVPSINLERALVDAGKNFQIRGQGKKTYKGAMLSQISVEPDKLYISPPDWEVDIQAVKIQGKQTFRARPLFKEGWVINGRIRIMDPDLMPETLKDIVEYAGSHVGVCDYRPRYGQFEIASWNVK